MNARVELARRAVGRAFSYRLENAIPLDVPCDVYELIARQGLDLQFVDIPSLEGMYLDEPESRRICVCSHRPYGRQRFTAAHELGHSAFQHGTHIDEVVQGQASQRRWYPNEWVADCFAAHLLMPPRAVQTAFRQRNVDPRRCDPLSAFKVACWLGVGYEALLNHLELSLNILSHSARGHLSKTTPKAIKSKLYREAAKGDVWPLDEHWTGVRVHACVGDVLLGLRTPLPSAARDEGILVAHGSGAVEAVGIGETFSLLNSGASVRISVARRAYVGFYEYMYLPENACPKSDLTQ